MHGTTRELNVATITFVSVVFVLLLITIVAGSTAWFRYEFRKQEQARVAQYGTSDELERLNAEQHANLAGDDSGVPIDDAIEQVAERY